MGIDEARLLAAARTAAEGKRNRERLAETRRRAALSLHLLRRELRLSKAELARLCCVSRNTVERWEDPESPSTPDAAQVGALVVKCGADAAGWLVKLIGLPWAE